MHRAFVALLFVLVACATPTAPIPRTLDDVPGHDVGLDRRSWRARRLYEAGRAREALEVLDGVLREAPGYVDAHRVRQDILRERGRMGLLLWEAEQRLELQPGAASQYLAGRLARTDDEKLGFFRRALELDKGSFWAWLGLAYVLRHRAPVESLEVYRRLYEVSHGHPLTAIALASMLRSSDPRTLGGPPTVAHMEEAVRVYERLCGNPLAPGVGELGLAQTNYLRDKVHEAWPALLQAMKLRAYDPAVHGLVQQYMGRGLPSDQLNQILDVLHQDSSRFEEFATNGGAPVLAALLDRTGLPFAARAVLETSDGIGPSDPVLRRRWQRLLLETGEVRGFLESVRRNFPKSLLEDERNQVRGVWVRLFTGPWMDAADPVSRPAVSAGLAEALLRAGFLVEAEMICSMALLRHAAQPARQLEAIHDLREEARRELSFERSLRRVLYRGYARFDHVGDLDGCLDQLRRISIETFKEDVVGAPRRFHIPLVGDLLDSFGPGLFEHLARYNHYLVLGQRNDLPPEGMMLRRLSVRELEPDEQLPLRAPSTEVVGEDRSVRSRSGVYGGDLAGVALINHTVIDMDSVREWANEIRERREIIREDGGVMLDDPLPTTDTKLDPVSVQWRLSMLSPVGDTELSAAVLNMIRWHERAHLVDALHFLPVENNLWRGPRIDPGPRLQQDLDRSRDRGARRDRGVGAESAHSAGVGPHRRVLGERLAGIAARRGISAGGAPLGATLEEGRPAGPPRASGSCSILPMFAASAREMLQEQW